MRARRGIAAVLLAVAALTAAACGDDGAEPPAVSQELRVDPDAKPVELRSDVASALDSTVFLVAHAVRTGERVGFDSALYRSAREALDKETDKLVEHVSPLFDFGRRDEFEDELTELVDLLLGYGRDQVDPGFSTTPFRARVKETIGRLRDILLDAGDDLRPEDLDDHLELTVDQLFRTLEKIALDERGQLAHAVSAAERSRGLAGVLAVATTRDDPALRPLANSEPARIAADLRALLEEDFHLVFGAVQVGLAEGFDSPVWLAAGRQVDESAKSFADRMATIPEVGGGRVTIPAVDPPATPVPDDSPDLDTQVTHYRAIRDSLRLHWQILALYAREVTGDLDVEDLTRSELEERLHSATTIFADVLADATAVPRPALLIPLENADEEIIEAIEALTDRDPEAYDHLIKALEHVATAADRLTDGVIRIQVERASP